MNQFVLQPAFILHLRQYRDSSMLVDAFSQEQGRVSLIAQGVRSAKHKTGRLLQLFSPLLLSWQGRTELMKLTHIESGGVPTLLFGKALLSAFYLNEVLVRLLQRGDSLPGLYKTYEFTLQSLSQSVNISSVLRFFEKNLLIELGYGLTLTHDLQGVLVDPEKKYLFTPGVGFKCLISGVVSQPCFSGASLLALHHACFKHQHELQEAKQLMRLALAPLLGEKPLKSRVLRFICVKIVGIFKSVMS